MRHLVVKACSTQYILLKATTTALATTQSDSRENEQHETILNLTHTGHGLPLADSLADQPVSDLPREYGRALPLVSGHPVHHIQSGNSWLRSPDGLGANRARLVVSTQYLWDATIRDLLKKKMHKQFDLCQYYFTCSILEMSHGLAPECASSTIFCLVASGNGRPDTKTPPSWLMPECPITF